MRVELMNRKLKILLNIIKIKKSDLDQIALKLIDTLYQNVDKIKKKKD